MRISFLIRVSEKNSSLAGWSYVSFKCACLLILVNRIGSLQAIKLIPVASVVTAEICWRSVFDRIVSPPKGLGDMICRWQEVFLLMLNPYKYLYLITAVKSFFLSFLLCEFLFCCVNVSWGSIHDSLLYAWNK